MAKAMDRNGDRILWTDKGSKTKKKVIGIKSNFLLFFTLLLLFLIGGTLLYVWSRIQEIKLRYEISSCLKVERT